MSETVKVRKRPPYKEFLAWMILNDVSRQDLTELLGLTDSALSRRLNGTGADFKPEEIRTIVAKFGNETSRLFFF